MSAIEQDVLGRFAEAPRGAKGPVTAARHRRNAIVYAALFLLGLAPTWLGGSAAWQAAGLGLLVPGGGFLALGAHGIVLLALTVAVFWLACVAWFWAGMVVAPLTVWLGSALLAGATVGDVAWAPGAWLAPLAAAGLFAWFQYRGMKRRAADRASYALRQTFFEASRSEVNERVRAEPEAGTRELDLEQLKSLRYVYDRALQPVGEFAGYTVIDQFQPAALRYQINHLGFALAIAQTHYAPSFTGYLGQAQRNLVETYLDPKVWTYWVLESMWGHFNFTNFDPAAKDNIMLTGWYGMHVNAYMKASGDRRYAEPGSLTFRLNDSTAFAHSAHTLAQSVADNLQRSDFCLYPCEPNWVYPVCNMYGMSSLAAHDAVFGSDYVQRLLPHWLDQLETEFTDGKGSIIGLRSYWTGLEIPFYAGEAGFAFFANVFSPALARRLWAVGRKELAFCLAENAAGRQRLSIPPEAMSFIDTIDPGNYRKGVLFPYAAVAICGREFGDDDLADAAIESMDEDCGRVETDGVVSYTKASCLANVWAVEGKLLGTGDFRNTFVKGPPETALSGPALAAAAYPEVLVAKAFSDGAALDLVLYPGRADGPQTLAFERLLPGRAYAVSGALEAVLSADGEGRAQLEVPLSGRTVLKLAPRT
ncbi:MAG: hypothetical protein H6977_08085 [Gammaproteobacteria bacterium]|nr:hypothetical protein [Gammaproteobacteria bacterium]MCP5199957.1 hypothetical protein [Gammaproteobacteria bacterium]